MKDSLRFNKYRRQWDSNPGPVGQQASAKRSEQPGEHSAYVVALYASFNRQICLYPSCA